MTRMMSGREHAITTMTYSAITGVCILSALVPFVWVTPTWHDILFGVFIGVASTAGQWIVVLAFRYADASVLAPFSYTQLMWVSIGRLPGVRRSARHLDRDRLGVHRRQRSLHRASRAGAAVAASDQGRAFAEPLTRLCAGKTVARYTW